MSDKEMTVGTRIRDARKREGISQTDLAQRIGVIKQTLYKYENGIVSNIPADKIVAAARELGVTPGYLMGWEDKNPEQFAKARHRIIDDMLDQLSPSELKMVEGILREILREKER